MSDTENPEILTLLRVIAMNTSKSTDDSYQFPRPNETSFQLAAGATYDRTLYPKRRLMKLAVALPSGVVAYIYKNGTPWRRYTGIFKYDDGVNGEQFNEFRIVVQNTNATAATWDVTATFV
jgi:hypothetical protein